jgi:KaiC/GvpD/RAD55 family RecA-like ATPase
MVRVPTGIPGFDELIQGGFNEKSVNLLAGGPGCGKSIFCMQFLWNGLTKYNQNGVFISFEEAIDDLRKDALEFGWDFAKYESEGKFKFIYFQPYEVTGINEEIRRIVNEVNAKHVVIDSSTVYGMALDKTFDIRKGLFELCSNLKMMNCVSILTTEIQEGSTTLKHSHFGVEEFLADSIILLSFESMGGEFSRSLMVRKMRRTKNDEDIHPLEINSTGVVVHNIK